MARGTALNPCLEHAAWLGASHDVTCCRSGGGDSRTGQRAFIWAMDGHRRCYPRLSISDAGQQLLIQGRLRLLLSLSAPNSTSCPAEESWWSGMVIIIAVCCASLVFLTVLVIICYKAIKR